MEWRTRLLRDAGIKVSFANALMQQNLDDYNTASYTVTLMLDGWRPLHLR